MRPRTCNLRIINPLYMPVFDEVVTYRGQKFFRYGNESSDRHRRALFADFPFYALTLFPASDIIRRFRGDALNNCFRFLSLAQRDFNITMS